MLVLMGADRIIDDENQFHTYSCMSILDAIYLIIINDIGHIFIWYILVIYPGCGYIESAGSSQIYGVLVQLLFISIIMSFIQIFNVWRSGTIMIQMVLAFDASRYYTDKMYIIIFRYLYGYLNGMWYILLMNNLMNNKNKKKYINICITHIIKLYNEIIIKLYN
eukprot:313997_1